MLFRLIAFAVCAVLCQGCAFIHQAGVNRKTNPRFRNADPAELAPMLALPIGECHIGRRRATRDSRQRKLFAMTVPPKMWESAGLPGTAQTGSTPLTPTLCDELLGHHLDSWNGSPILVEAVGKALRDRSAQSVLVTLYIVQHECRETQRAIRDRNGVQVGSVATGEECHEQGDVLMSSTLLDKKGVIVWHAEAKCGGYVGQPDARDCGTQYEKAETVTTELFEGLPHPADVELWKGAAD
jgi:hypothetical protein